jgi:hypothetical protein
MPKTLLGWIVVWLCKMDDFDLDIFDQYVRRVGHYARLLHRLGFHEEAKDLRVLTAAAFRKGQIKDGVRPAGHDWVVKQRKRLGGDHDKAANDN